MNQCFGCNTCASADKPLEGFIRNLPMELLIIEWKDRVQNVVLVYRVYAAVFAPMVHVVLHQKLQEEFVVLQQMLLLRVTSFMQWQVALDAIFIL